MTLEIHFYYYLRYKPIFDNWSLWVQNIIVKYFRNKTLSNCRDLNSLQMLLESFAMVRPFHYFQLIFKRNNPVLKKLLDLTVLKFNFSEC